MVTVVPPAVGPGVGLTAVTVGASDVGELVGGQVAEVPPGGGHRDVDRAGGPAGAVAVIEVAELTVTLVAAVVPNLTAVAPARLVPVMVTVVPPAPGPRSG